MAISNPTLDKHCARQLHGQGRVTKVLVEDRNVISVR